MMQNVNLNIRTLNFFDLLEDKKNNLYSFINENLKKILGKFGHFITSPYEILQFYPDEYFFKFPTIENKKILDNETINFSLYIPTELFNKKTNILKRFNLFICNLPLVIDNNAFWINGTPKNIHQQLSFDPSIFIDPKSETKQITIYDEKQEKILEIFFDENDDIKIEEPHLKSSSIVVKPSVVNKKTPTNPLNDLYIINKKQNLLEKRFNSKSERLKSVNKKLENIEIAKQVKITEKTRYKLNNKLKVSIPNNILYLTELDIDKMQELLSKVKNYEIVTTDLDDLENKSIKYLKEYLTNIFSHNINKLNFFIDINDQFKLSAVDFINKIKQNTISSEIDELFSNSDVSLPIEQTNPLSEISQQRKLLNLKKQEGNKNISIDIRNIHASIFGHLCPIDTPEGDSAGLINSLTTLALSNNFGLLETPLFFIKNNKAINNAKVNYYNTNNDNLKIIKFAINQTSYFSTRLKNNIKINKDFAETNINESNFSFLSYLQVFSLACSNIPFLEHNDGNRILMGANMQKQAVPLLFPENVIVGSGIEEVISLNSNILKSLSNGIIIYTDSTKIVVKTLTNKKLVYFLDKIKPTFNETTINFTNSIWIGEEVLFGQILAQGFSVKDSELALGTNLTVAYMNWDGFNFEDAILISDKLVKNDKLTSLHIKTILIEIDADEEFYSNYNNLRSPLKNNKLSNFGLIMKNKNIKSGDILIIKEKIEYGQKTSSENKKLVFVESDFDGFISNIEMLVPEVDSTNNNKIEHHNRILKIDILQTRKIHIGDKLSGRYGNKGVISKIIPEIDMPFLLDGTPIDVLLNPLGIPSRMNVGQIFETLLGFAGTNLHTRYKLLSFDECFGKYASKVLVNQKLKESKLKLKKSYSSLNDNNDKNYVIDGRSGELADNPVLVGRTYILKLFHLSQDKITSRTMGPNTLITNQPLKGKKSKGGQRLGEMEVWALEAYGASYTLNEMLTTKSDDIFMNDRLSIILEKDLLLDRINYSKSLFILDLDLKALGFDLNLTIENIVENEITSNDILNSFKRQDLFMSATEIFKNIYNHYGKK